MTDRPRLGFLGVGWIGRHRLEAVHRAGAARVCAVADPDRDAARAAAAAAGGAQIAGDLPALLARDDLDGIVIATPTALHAEQAEQALEAGLAVFCQKPLGRTASECRAVVEHARRSDRLLGVDLSYRHLAATDAVAARLRDGAIGRPHAVELTFHNAYGPDKAWVRDARLAGGGALIDLGCHLLDLAARLLGPLRPASVHADLYAAGRRLEPDPAEVEDQAFAQLTLQDGRTLRVSCSWWLSAGQDAVIEAVLHGEQGALRIANIGGSFYDFEAEERHGTRAERLVGPPDDWGGRAICAWARRLRVDPGFDPEAETLIATAELIDLIYGRAPVLSGSAA